MEQLDPELGLDWARVHRLVTAWYGSTSPVHALATHGALVNYLRYRGVPITASSSMVPPREPTSAEVDSYIRVILEGEAQRICKLFEMPQLAEPDRKFKPTHMLELHVDQPGYIIRIPVMHHEPTRGLFTISEWVGGFPEPADFSWMAGRVFLRGTPASPLYYERAIVRPLE